MRITLNFVSIKLPNLHWDGSLIFAILVHFLNFDSSFPCHKGSPGSSVGRTMDFNTRKVTGSIPVLKGPCMTISIFSTQYAVQVFRKRRISEVPSQWCRLVKLSLFLSKSQFSPPLDQPPPAPPPQSLHTLAGVF